MNVIILQELYLKTKCISQVENKMQPLSGESERSFTPQTLNFKKQLQTLREEPANSSYLRVKANERDSNNNEGDFTVCV